jgi:hypothetical protein
MIEFRPLKLEDADWVKPLLQRSGERGAEYSFANSLVWGSFFQQQIARVNNFFVAKAGIECPHYNFPCGEGDTKAILQHLMNDATAHGHPFRIRALSTTTKDKLETLFPGRFEYKSMRNNTDYIYAVKDLTELQGRKYQPKRNLVLRFQKNNEWSYENISRENLADCIAMNEEWCRRNGCKDNSSLYMETEAVMTMLRHFEDLALCGGILRVENNMVAYTIGEPLSDDTFIVHVEKAFTEFQGAYQMINQQFLLHQATGYTYVNREDDSGDEGLRKAKLSYHPAFLQEKFLATDKYTTK